MRQPVPVLLPYASGSDDFGVGSEYRFVIEAWYQTGKLTEDIGPTAQRHHLPDQVVVIDTHQWLIPHLIEHRDRLCFGVACGELGHAVTKIISDAIAFFFAAGQLRQAFDRRGHALDVTRLDVEHRYAQRLDGVELFNGVTGHPADHQIGL